MAFDVMQSLFGLTPTAVGQALKTEEENRALTQARMLQGNPFAAGAYGALQSGERMLTGVRNLTGQVDPRMQAAQQLQGIVQSVQQSGVDLATPEGMIALANELNKVPDFAGFAVGMRQQAAKMQAEGKKAALGEAKTMSEIQKNIAQANKASQPPAPPEAKKVGVASDDGQIVYMQGTEQFKLGPGGTKVPYYGSVRKESGDITVNAPKEIAAFVKQGMDATSDITKNTRSIGRALQLNSQNSPFAGSAFKQEVASIFGDAQKAASEIQALANTGSLDTRVANRIKGFIEGSSTDATKEDRDAVLKALLKRNEDEYERTLSPLRAAIGDETEALRIFPKFKDRYPVSPGIRKGIPIPASKQGQYKEGSKWTKGNVTYVVRNGELVEEGK
jgi:hypothetical protein